YISTATSVAANTIWPTPRATPQEAPNALPINAPTTNAPSTVASWLAGVALNRRKRLVLAEHALHRAADLAQRCVGVNGVDDRRHQVVGVLVFGGGLERGQSLLGGGVVARVAQLFELLALAVGKRGVDPEVLGLRLFLFAVLVQSDHHPLAGS